MQGSSSLASEGVFRPPTSEHYYALGLVWPCPLVIDSTRETIEDLGQLFVVVLRFPLSNSHHALMSNSDHFAEDMRSSLS